MNSRELMRSVFKSATSGWFSTEQTYKKRKLRELLRYAKENSPLYRELYKDIDVESITPDNIAILPPVTKSQLIERYDEWTCDRNVNKEEVMDFVSDVSNINELYLDKYIVDSTSGTTGEKLKVLNHKDEFAYMMARGALCTWPKLSYPVDILKSGRPLVYIIPTDGFYASLMIANTYLGLSKSSESEILDFRTPTDELVRKLNRINPVLLGGYVSTFLVLADEIESGRLHIDTKYVVTIGTAYTKEARERIENKFKCTTFTSYSCTEGGEIGCECVNGHYHIAKDTIIEAADDLMQPIEDGKESKCILLTNLWNKQAPFIRYRLNDRCIVHSEPCGCGRKSKWVEVTGREVMKIPFVDRNGQKAQLTDFQFEIILNEVCTGLADHQLIIDGNSIEVRLDIHNMLIQRKVFKQLRERIEHTGDINNIQLEVRLSDDKPSIENSGKFKRIIVKA